MATYYIFIDGKEKEEQLGINSRYIYKFETLIVYRDDLVIFHKEAHSGDAFSATCDRGKVIVNRMIPPNRKGRLIAWLLGFQQHNRADSESEYELKLAKYRQRYEWPEYEEWEYKSEGYVFTQCTREDKEGKRNVAAFFSDTITKREVLELIPLMKYHPDWYILRLLQEQFKVTEEEFYEARKNVF